MTITISNLEFLEYHDLEYAKYDKINNILQFIESKGASFWVKDNDQDVSIPSSGILKEPPKTYHGPQGIELSNLVIDSEIFELNVSSNEDYINDENFKEYIESQRSHRLHFLNEIKEKGLKTKNDNENDNNDRVVHKNVTHLNY